MTLLVNLVRELGMDTQLPAVLAGEVPDPSNIPPGCPFRPRCSHAMDICSDDPPRVGADGREVLCWLDAPGEHATHHNSKESA